MYTKRHFEDLAKYFKTTKAITKDDILRELMTHFEADNNKFNKAKFLKACGVA